MEFNMKQNLVIMAVAALLSTSASAQLFGRSEAVKNLEAAQNELRRDQTVLNSEVRTMRESLSRTQTMMDNGPDWLTNPPQIANAVVVAVQGTRSTDRGRALEKAIHKGYAALSIKINSEVDTLTKNFEFESADSTVEEYQSFTRAVSKAQLEGVQRIKTEIVKDGRHWYAMVLMAYPLGENNPLRKMRQQAEAKREGNLRAQRAEQELNQNNQRRSAEDRHRQEQQRQEIGPRPENSNATTEPSTTSRNTVQLLDVDNEEYKRRRDATLVRPGAVIGQITVQ